MFLKKLFTIFSLTCLAGPCLASNALRGKAFRPDQNPQKKRTELVINEAMFVKEEPLFTHEDVAEIVPTRFQENETSQSVVSRIVQNTANKIMESDVIKNSFLMKTAKKVEKNTNMDIKIKQEGSQAAKQGIEHKVNFDVQALQGQAKITYTGLVDSRIEYQAANNTLQVSIEERLSPNSRIALSHLNDQQQSRQLIQYQINW